MSATSYPLNRERDSKGVFLPIHGMKHTRLYRVWGAMKERCNNPHNKSYSRYGGKGVKVCREWNDSFSVFADWAESHGYEDGLTIDRIDNGKGYYPENCRWVTTAIQNRNYSRNHLITYHGETKCITDWAIETGINKATILFRLKSGKSLDEVFSKEDGRAKRWNATISRNYMP